MKTQVVAVTTRSAPVADAFHLIMSILTAGLWIPVWIACARGRKRVTRVPATGNGDGLAQARDPEWRAEHVPASAEYRARHGR